MVLEDVAAGAGLLVERAAALDAEVLGHGDLHVVDVAPVPDRLEDAVAEAEDEQVADGLLAQVVVDAVDLRLVEDAHDRVVEVAAGLEVVAEGLLDDDARPGPRAAGEARRAQVGHDVLVGAGRRGEVEEPVAAAAGGGVDLVQPLGEAGVGGGVAEVALLVVDAGGEVVPEGRLDRVARVLRDGGAHLRAEVGVRVRPPREAHDARLRRQQAGAPQVVEGGQDLAMGEVAGGAEDDHDGRVGDPLEARADAQRVGVRGVASRVAVHDVPCAGGGLRTCAAPVGRLRLPRARRPRGHRCVRSYLSLTAWPPNCWRSAASTWAA